MGADRADKRLACGGDIRRGGFLGPERLGKCSGEAWVLSTVPDCGGVSSPLRMLYLHHRIMACISTGGDTPLHPADDENHFSLVYNAVVHPDPVLFCPVRMRCLYGLNAIILIVHFLRSVSL